jgi:hypothetical protein
MPKKNHMTVKNLIFLFCALMFLACRDHKPSFFFEQKKNCDLVDTNSFVLRIKNNWPARKPNSIADAIKLLDLMADKNFKCAIIQISDENLYFNLGLKIRNDWVRQGDHNIKNEFFSKLNLSNPEYSSGLIIDIYRQLLISKKVDLVKFFSGIKNYTFSSTVTNELKEIQSELDR